MASKTEFHTDKFPGMIKLSLLKRSCASGWEVSLTYRKMENYCTFRLKQSYF